MKRVISLLILLVLLLLMLEWGTTLLKSSHKIEYQVNSSKKTFKVIEEFQKKNDNTYYLEIISDNHTFIYDVTNTFNKQKEIIESIEVYEKNDINDDERQQLHNEIDLKEQTLKHTKTLFKEKRSQKRKEMLHRTQ